MALNFPDSPSVNDIYRDTVSGFSYQWDGTVWQSYSDSSLGQIKILDDISGSFNGSTQTFAITSSSTAVTPANAQQVRVVLGGVVQDPSSDYTVSGSNITFTTPPAGGLSFSGIVFGNAVPINTITDGSVTEGSLRISTKAVVGAATTFTEDLVVNGNARVVGVLTVGTSSLTLNGDTNEINGVTISSGVVTATSFVGDGSGLTGAGSTVVDDTSTNATFYPLFTETTSGTVTSSKVSTTKLSFNPSTGTLSATAFSGDGSNLIFQPNALSFNPVATSTGISTTTNITVIFDQDIEFSGVGTIYIREGSVSGTIATSFTCGVSTEATISGSTLVIDPRDPLSFNQLYVVTLPSVGIANTFGQYYRGTNGYSFTTTQQGFAAVGGNSEFTLASPTSPTGYHKYHVFTSTGILTTTAPSFDADDLYSILVAGGGAGNLSGGGAGGVFKNTGPELALSVGTYTVTIGAGGAASPTYFLNPPDFGDGENSTISTSPTNVLVSAYGGGRGSLNNGSSTPNPIIIAGNPGGSGGGSHGTPAGTLGGTGIPGQGTSGGQGYPSPTGFSRTGSGGGGAGGAGISGSVIAPPTSNTYTITGGSGGAGTPVPQFTSSIIGGRVPSIPTATITEIGTSGLYGGGGGGGTPQDSPTWPVVFTGGTGGVGGGGNGYLLSPPVARPNESGYTNTGGGGGGGAHVIVPGSPTGTWFTGGAGGSGVFMIRYAVPAP